MFNEVVKDVMKAVKHEKTLRVPVALWDLAPWMPSMAGVNCLDYYRNVDIKLQVQMKMQEYFPEAILFPGIHPDFGVIIEASAMGCPIQWLDDDAPFAHKCLEKPEDVLKLKVVDPQNDGLMPQVLKEYKYMRQACDKKLLTDYGYIEGHAFSMGPAEIAALMRGYDGLFYDFYDCPELVHKLLTILTESIIKWLRAQEKVNGQIKRLFIADHLSSELSPSLYKEYFFPYMKQIFTEFSYAEIRLWHNEGRSEHIFQFIPDMGCNIYQFGADPIEKIKASIGHKICLMGNLHSVKEIRNASKEEIKNYALDRLEIGAEGGGYILSGAGGLAPGTTKEKVRALIEATFIYQNN
ncbi:uroporphyrinogen decarboxylase family protein [Neomoorella mulderi]|uniref:uroporphyrinogen decarboxylase family protein n=1 Tax=Neomoorella mulderi TaxID=202604 RepID=UPI0007858C01|nr:uroporphyrinogen decarboxylase family protein [Moorella mulderi]